MAYIGLTDSQRDAFSIVRGVRALAFPNVREYQDAAAFEKDVSKETAEAYDREISENSLVIPDDVLRHKIISEGELVERGLLAGTDASGGYTVDDELQSLIDIFVENNWASQNVTVLSGLTGNVTIPGQDNRATAGWTGEITAAQETQGSFREVAFKPKHARSWTRVSRQLVIQSSFDVEMFIRRDLGRAIAKLVDTALMYGAGSTTEPLGITRQDNIKKFTVDDSLNGEAQEKLIDIVLDAEEHVADENLPEGECEWLISNKMRRRMKQVAFFGDYTEEALIDRNSDLIMGIYPYSTSSQVNAPDAFFARWRDAILAVWEGMRVQVNPYTDDITGQIRITIEKMVDTNLLRQKSFCWTTAP